MDNISKMRKLWSAFLLLTLALGARAQAVAPPSVSNGNILPGPENGTSGKAFVGEIMLPVLTNGFLVFLLIVAVVMFIIAGIMYIFSGGKTETADKARQTIIWTCVAVGVAAMAYTIVRFIININFLA